MSWLRAVLVAVCGSIALAHAQSARFNAVEHSIPELQAAMAAGRVTSHALVQQYLDRIAAYDQQGPALNAMIALNARALADADALDRERASGHVRGPLHGIPIVVKDNYDTFDMPTTAASLSMKGSMAERDAFQVRKLRDAGVVIVGKTNLHEFARGITSVSTLGGQTRNPYDPTRNPGGSSGGTGAAVAANFAAAGMGTDTCGSIRYPAAHNNLVGLRPTMGLSSRSGIVPLAHSQDVGGPLAKTVTDVALMLDATVGRDADDPVTARSDGHIPRTYLTTLDVKKLQGARIGVLLPLFGKEPEDLRAGSVVRTAIRAMEQQGAKAIDVEVPDFPSETDVSVIRFEFKFDLNAYLQRTPKAPVRSLSEILEKGAYLKALEQGFRRSNEIATLDTPEYKTIVERQQKLREQLIALLDQQRLSALVYPTLKRTAAKIGEPQTGGNCAASAATGLPAITIPAGFADDGMPVGVELLGRPFAEAELLGLAFAYEQTTHHRRLPAMTPNVP
ncbi:MAG TPA: amidase family protein [Vicinamibacterales bacterium]|nr:amidase family protein [Vicinamibacterales bacterium]